MAATAGYGSQVLIGSLPSVAFTDEATTTSDLTTFTISNSVKRYLDKSVATVVQKANDELQTVTITGAPTGGTFTLTFGGNTTSALNWNATASQVQTALQALASIGSGNALVTGGPGPATPYVVQFTAGKGLTNQASMTAAPSFTGGSSPSVNIVETQAGGTWATISSGYTLYRAGGRVVFTSAQPTGTQVRLHSGNYIPYATLAEAKSCDFAGKMDMADSTFFNQSAYTWMPTTLSCTVKLGTLWASNARATSATARDLIIASFLLPSGNRYEGFCFASDLDIKGDPKSLITQDITFQLTDEFFNA